MEAIPKKKETKLSFEAIKLNASTSFQRNVPAPPWQRRTTTTKQTKYLQLQKNVICA
jgi:hypothetical protein